MIVVATAGHVDHGKSTLIRALTGMEPDRYAEEQRRGMTIDLGFAWAEIGGHEIAFVDVPGHERFVGTMLAGVGPVPAVLLAVAADEGWMPQTAEHVAALAALGVRDGVLVLTRSDLMDPDLARDDVRAHLAGTSLAAIPDVAVSARTRAELDALRAALGALAERLPTPDPAADVRLWVDRVFTVRGAGTVVTGTLPAGRIAVGDALDLDGGTVTVRGMQSLGADVDTATGTARVALNLRGLPRDAVGRGAALLTPGAWLRTELIDVGLIDVGGPADELPSEVTVHVGSAAVPARVRRLGPGAARLRPARPLPLRIADRLVLRDPGNRRVVGATVLDVVPVPLRRRGAAAALAAELGARPVPPDAAAEVARRGLVRAADLRAMGVPGDPPAVAGWLLSPERAAAAARALAAAVDTHDAADPLQPGLPTEEARRAADLPDARLLDALLGPAGLRRADGRIGRARPDPVAGLPVAVRIALDALAADLRRDPFAAPDAGRLAELGLGRRELASLVRAGALITVADGVVLLPDAADRAVTVLAGLDEEFTLSAARQALHTSRRVAVPLLELLARTGRSARTAEGTHRLRAPAGRSGPGALP